MWCGEPLRLGSERGWAHADDGQVHRRQILPLADRAVVPVVSVIGDGAVFLHCRELGKAQSVQLLAQGFSLLSGERGGRKAGIATRSKTLPYNVD